MCKSVFFMQFYWNNCLISLVPTLPCVQGVVMASGEAGSKYYPQKETSVANLLQYKSGIFPHLESISFTHSCLWFPGKKIPLLVAEIIWKRGQEVLGCLLAEPHKNWGGKNWNIHLCAHLLPNEERKLLSRSHSMIFFLIYTSK